MDVQINHEWTNRIFQCHVWWARMVTGWTLPNRNPGLVCDLYWGDVTVLPWNILKLAVGFNYHCLVRIIRPLSLKMSPHAIHWFMIRLPVGKMAKKSGSIPAFEMHPCIGLLGCTFRISQYMMCVCVCDCMYINIHIYIYILYYIILYYIILYYIILYYIILYYIILYYIYVYIYYIYYIIYIILYILYIILYILYIHIIYIYIIYIIYIYYILYIYYIYYIYIYKCVCVVVYIFIYW